MAEYKVDEEEGGDGEDALALENGDPASEDDDFDSEEDDRESSAFSDSSEEEEEHSDTGLTENQVSQQRAHPGY